MSSPHVVFMNIAATGHMNPTLPLVAELRARGCHVSYFVDATMQDVVEAAGATWFPFRYPHGDKTGTLMTLDEEGIAKYVPDGTAPHEFRPLPQCMLYNAEVVLPALLEDLQKLQPRPSVIVYEPFIAFARVAAHILGLPTVSLLTVPGPGVLKKPEAVIQMWESKPWVTGPRQAILDQYGIDVLKDCLLQEFYSPSLNLVTTIDELYAPPTGDQSHRFGHFPFKCVGVLLDAKVKRVSNATMSASKADDKELMSAIEEAVASGRKIVYVSMGTVATGNFWNAPFGHPGKANGLELCTGKMIIQHVFKACFEALGGFENTLVVVSAGPHDDVFEGLPCIPSNFLVRKAVPQLEVLKHCSAFVTHGGANSMHEALSLALPMAVVPIFGDQPANATSVAQCGAGLAFHQPLTSVTADSIRTGIEQLIESTNDNAFKAAACKMSDKLAAAGGKSMAVDCILEKSNHSSVSTSRGGA